MITCKFGTYRKVLCFFMLHKRTSPLRGLIIFGNKIVNIQILIKLGLTWSCWVVAHFVFNVRISFEVAMN